GFCIETANGKIGREHGLYQVTFCPTDELRRLGVEERLTIVTQHQMNRVGTITVQERVQPIFGQHTLVPIEDAEFLDVARMNTCRTSEIAAVRRVGDQA